jgi:hypothetical protein
MKYIAIIITSLVLLITACGGSSTSGKKVPGYNLLSSSALLSDIALSEGVLTPVFQPGIQFYKAEVSSLQSSLTITPTLYSDGAAITVNGSSITSGAESDPVSLVSGINRVSLKVVAENKKDITEYTIEIIRLPGISTNAYLVDLVPSDGTLTPMFRKNLTDYTLEVADSVNYISITPLAAGVNAIIEVNDTIVETNTPSGDIELTSGLNIVNVKVTAEDTSNIINYQIAVTKLSGLSSNTYLAGIEVSGGRLHPQFDPITTDYSIYTNQTSISVTPWASGVNSILSINGSETESGVIINNLSAAAHTITVESQDGSQQTYNITVITDTIPPQAGDISLSMAGTNHLSLTWPPAVDDNTPGPDLEYAVYMSSSDNISSIADAEANGSLLKSYTADSLSVNIQKLTPESSYYFAVIVRDLAGNKSIKRFNASTLHISVFKRIAPNGQVFSLAEHNGIIYLGGSFQSIGLIAPYNALFDKDSGELVSDYYPETNDQVKCVTPDGEGGWYIGGQFTTVFGINRNRIAHIRSDGTLSDWNPDANNIVNVIKISGSTLYIGGSFTSIGGKPRNRIAAIDADSGLATSWDPNADNSVLSIAVGNSVIYAAGHFSNIGGGLRNKIASLDPITGNATSWDPNSNSSITTIALNGSVIYAGGNFTNIGGQPRNRIAALDAASGNALLWNPNSNHNINSIIVSGSTVYAGGVFTNIGGEARNRIAAIDSVTGYATSWNPDADNTVYTISLDGSLVYIGGAFSTIGGQPRNCFAAVDADTAIAAPWNPDSGGQVFSIAVSGSRIYAGGMFKTMKVQPRKWLAAVDGQTGTLKEWNPGADLTVETLAATASTVYAGGQFSSIGGQSRNKIAAIDAVTGNVTDWNPNADSIVRAIAVTESKVYVGGTFTSIGGQNRNRIAALDAITGNATDWNPNADLSVHTFAVTESKVYVGGSFTSIGGQSRNRIAALDPATGNATEWNPNANATVYTIKVTESKVYVGGNFTSIGGQNRNSIATIDPVTGNATEWNPDANSFIRKMILNGSTVYVCGNFTNIGGQPRNRIAAIDAVTGTATPWNPNCEMQVYDLIVSNESIYASGPFSMINNRTILYFTALDKETGLIR